MPTHAELASKLLIDAADFPYPWRTKPPLKDQMEENATVFKQMGALLTQEPQGALNDTPHGELAGKLLIDAATFFTTLAEQNEPIKEQMLENANVYKQIGELVIKDPLGILD